MSARVRRKRSDRKQSGGPVLAGAPGVASLRAADAAAPADAEPPPLNELLDDTTSLCSMIFTVFVVLTSLLLFYYVLFGNDDGSFAEGNHLMDVGDYEGAVAQYTAALHGKPADAEHVLNNMALALFRLGDHAAAMRTWRRALTAASSRGWFGVVAQFHLANAMYDEGRVHEALVLYGGILDLNTTCLPDGGVDEAAAAAASMVAKSTALNGTAVLLPPFRERVATVRSQLLTTAPTPRPTLGASAHHDAPLLLDPDEATRPACDAAHFRGHSAAASGQAHECVVSPDATGAPSHDVDGGVGAEGWSASGDGEGGEGLGAPPGAPPLLAIASYWSEMEEELGALVSESHIPAAPHVCLPVASTTHDFAAMVAQATLLSGSVLREMGMHADAEASLRRASQLLPMLPEPLLQLGELALQRGHNRSAAHFLKRCTRAGSPSAVQSYCHYLLGLHMEEQDDGPRALAHYDRAVELKHDLLLARNARARLSGSQAPDAVLTAGDLLNFRGLPRGVFAAEHVGQAMRSAVVGALGDIAGAGWLDVLEIGCEHALALRHFGDAANRLAGTYTDVGAPNPAKASLAYSWVRVQDPLAAVARSRGDVYDLVLVPESLIHIPALHAFLQDARKLLYPKHSLLVVTVVLLRSELLIAPRRVLPNLQLYGHSPASVERMIVLAGYRVAAMRRLTGVAPDGTEVSGAVYALRML